MSGLAVTGGCVYGCEHWRLTADMEKDLASTHHGMLLGVLGLTRQQAAERGITRAEARRRTGAQDIKALVGRRWLLRGTKLMQVHRKAPSLPSILFAGQLPIAVYSFGRRASLDLQRRGGGRPRGARLQWEDQYLPLLGACLGRPPGAELTDAVVEEQDYSEIEKWPMESRAREEVQCPHCRIMQNSRVGLQQHIARRHSGSSSGDNSDNNNGNTDTQDHGAPAATGGT